MFVAVGAVQWLDMARIVRGQALSIRGRNMCSGTGARVSPAGILWRHVVPNTLGRCGVHDAAGAAGHPAGELPVLSRLGVQEPLTSWGVLIAQGAKNIPSANWLLIFPSLFLTRPVRAELPRDGLRDALDRRTLRWPPRPPPPRRRRLDVRFDTPEARCTRCAASARPEGRRDAGRGRRIRLRQEPDHDGGHGPAGQERPGHAACAIAAGRSSASPPVRSTRWRRQDRHDLPEPMTSLDRSTPSQPAGRTAGPP